MYKIKNFFKFIFKEIILKYLLCYIISIILLLIAFLLSIPDTFNNWLISFSASIFSFPVIFVIYTLYSNALNKQTQAKISEQLQTEVNNIFARYLYFTGYFYYKIEDEIPNDAETLNRYLSYSHEKIFSSISDNIFSGIFLFSEFDTFDSSIYDLINEPIIARYANQEEIATLLNFIKAYKDLKNIFNSISDTDFIKYGEYQNINIEESNYLTNTNGRTFYDSMWLLEDGNVSTFYSAMYPLFEEENLLIKIKISGNKTNTIATAISQTYKYINKWLKLHNKSKIVYNQSIVLYGRLHIDYDLTFNQYMRNNISIRNTF